MADNKPLAAILFALISLLTVPFLTPAFGATATPGQTSIQDLEGYSGQSGVTGDTAEGGATDTGRTGMTDGGGGTGAGDGRDRGGASSASCRGACSGGNSGDARGGDGGSATGGAARSGDAGDGGDGGDTRGGPAGDSGENVSGDSFSADSGPSGASTNTPTVTGPVGVMGAAVAAETNSQDSNLLSSQESDQSNVINNVESQLIIIEDNDDVEITGPTDECLGGVITVNQLPVLCLTVATAPLGPFAN